MYFLYVSRGRKNFLGEILWVLPLQKQLFFSTPGSSSSFAKIAVHAEMTICFNEATRLFALCSSTCSKKSFLESTMACTFCKKPGPIWYILASGASFLIYTPPIGGPHPVLYFPSQIQRNIVQRCARSEGGLVKDHTFPEIFFLNPSLMLFCI